MSHYSKCMVIKVHFSHFVCVSGVAFLRLTVYYVDTCTCVWYKWRFVSRGTISLNHSVLVDDSRKKNGHIDFKI